MHDEGGVAGHAYEQVLPATIDAPDLPSEEKPSKSRRPDPPAKPGLFDPNPADDAACDSRLERAAQNFDLGQRGEAVEVAPPGPAGEAGPLRPEPGG
jgi:hypothetical protein